MSSISLESVPTLPSSHQEGAARAYRVQCICHQDQEPPIDNLIRKPDAFLLL